jgi:hypothetical protein
MTGPIKPPGAPSTTPSIQDLARQDLGRAEGPARAEFRDQLAEGPTKAQSAGAVPTTELEALAARVRSGELSPGQAVDALVERALTSPMAAGLDDAGRAGLEAYLRAALEDDPVLSQMRGDVERSS